MIHGVVVAFELDLAHEDAERLRHGRDLFGIAGDADNAVGDVGDVCVHHVGRVALRVDRDEIGVDIRGLVAELLEPAVEFEQRRGADFRTMREAEEHRGRVAPESLFGDRLALLVDKRERRAIGTA